MFDIFPINFDRCPNDYQHFLCRIIRVLCCLGGNRESEESIGNREAKPIFMFFLTGWDRGPKYGKSNASCNLIKCSEPSHCDSAKNHKHCIQPLQPLAILKVLTNMSQTLFLLSRLSSLPAVLVSLTALRTSALKCAIVLSSNCWRSIVS